MLKEIAKFTLQRGTEAGGLRAAIEEISEGFFPRLRRT
jgi:hypothetical protein